MSMLIHRCRKCRHVEAWHGEADCSYGYCRCSRTRADMDPTPEVVPTWDNHTGAEVETVTVPGSVWNEGTRHRQVTCDCTACREAYDALPVPA